MLDVKFGRGAFMRERALARELAQAMVEVATRMGKPTRALLTSMDQPLGRTVGNALEVLESIECLRGRGPADVMEVTYSLGEHMLLLAGVAKDAGVARAMLARTIDSGTALEKFRQIISAQGGDVRVVDEPALLPQAKKVIPVSSPRSGFITDVEPMGVALCALRLGAGRARAEDRVDPAVGVSGLAKAGEWVEKGSPLAFIHANREGDIEAATEMLLKAISVGDSAPATQPLVVEVIGG